MISSEAFILAHLAIVLVGLVAYAVVERRGLRSFTSNNRGVRYRHMTSAEVIRLIRKIRAEGPEGR